jgi:hypothetical protein
MLMGKLGYVAPEQASLEKRWDHRVDIFAAGIILYELLTKQKPFPKATDVESLIESRRAKVVPPTAIDPRLPKDVDAILAKALAYDPENRYPDARSFCDALVDVLFPTPHSSIQDHLAHQIQQVFADKITRQRQGRSHDPLIMKVLSNAAEMRAQAERERTGSGIAITPSGSYLPAGSIAPFDPQAQVAHDVVRAARRAPAVRIVQRGVRARTAVVIGLLLAVAGSAGFHFASPWLRRGVVLVTSEPSGLEVTFDGQQLPQATPAVVEDVFLARPHVVTVGGRDVKELTAPVPREPGKLVARVHVKLQTAVGAITIDSVPPGAEITFDDRPAGRTPTTLRSVKLDQRHRIDLTLAGHEIDQFVVLPEKDGPRYVRRLSRAEPKGARTQSP